MDAKRAALVTGLAALALHLPFVVAVPGVHWDDAYIFFRFADNVASGQGWGFNPGQPSGGTTSALWTLILIPLARLGGPALPQLSKILGALLASASAALWAAALCRWTRLPRLAVAAGLVLAAVPVGVLLAVSGMETALVLLLLALAIPALAADGLRPTARSGLLLGLLALARPEVGVAFALAWGGAALPVWRRGAASGDGGWRLRGVLTCLGAAALVLLPYLLFSLWNSGHLVPPTRIGKLVGRLPQLHGITYADFLALDPLGRAGLALRNLAGLFGAGRGGITLAPFVALLVGGYPLTTLALRRRPRPPAERAPLLFLWLFAVILLGMLSTAFPIPNPRYAAPLIPVAVAGSALLAARLAGPALEGLLSGRRRIAAWTLLAAAILAVLTVSWRLYVPHAGEQQLRREVGVWLRERTEPDALIALEPIGEIGYYARREILDLGGLTEGDAWRCLQRGYDDPDCVMELFDARGVDYLIDYPPGYPLSLGAVVARYPGRFLHLETFRRGDVTHHVYRVLRRAENGG